MEEVEDLEAMEQQQLYVQVHVEAEDEDDQCYQWSCRLPSWKPLFPLRSQWAEAHGVIEAAVGFEDYLDRQVDLQRTPTELGWSSKAPVHLHAVPVDDRFAEGADGELPAKPPKSAAKAEAALAAAASAAAAAAPAPATAARGAGATAKRPRAAAAAGPPPPAPAELPAAEPATQPRRAEAPIAAALGRGARTAEQAAAEAAAAIAEPPLFVPLGGHRSTTIDLDDEPHENRRGDAGAALGSATAVAAETAAAPLRKRGRPATARGDAAPPAVLPASGNQGRGEDAMGGPCPFGDETVTFETRNPKKAGTGAYERYDKYKEARTAKEAMFLGASKGDLQHDFKKGFMKRC